MVFTNSVTFVARRPSHRSALFDDLDGEPGQLICRHVLRRPRRLPSDELEVIAGSDIDHARRSVLQPAIPGIALLGSAEEQTTVLVHPDASIAATAEGPVDVALKTHLGDAGGNGEAGWIAGGPEAVGVVDGGIS